MPSSRYLSVLAVLFAFESSCILIFSTPNHGFFRWAFLDSGADLTIQSMIARGLRPTMDFGYVYGLLPLLINRVWQAVFGATPLACRGLVLICHLFLVLGLAIRHFHSGRDHRWQIMAMVAMPDILLTYTIVLVQVLEPALLINAMAFQARGRRGIALALTTTCLFVKPSMGYLYGLVLLLSIISNERQRWWKTLIPAAATGLVIAAILMAVYGMEPLLRTLVPGKAIEVYGQGRYGFFGENGRSMDHPREKPPGTIFGMRWEVGSPGPSCSWPGVSLRCLMS